MHLDRTIELLGVHAEGEIGRVIVSGAPDIPGATMVDKMNYINTVDDSLLRRCLYEPRGAAQMTINLLVPPCRDDADMGFVPMQADGAHAMSGSNAICVATALLESGMVAPNGPSTVIRLDTPAGLVEAAVTWTGSKAERVEVDMPASFVEHLDHPLRVEGLGSIAVDVAFGGCYFVLIVAESLGFEIAPREARDLVDLGLRISEAAAAQITVRHPETPELNRIEYPMFVSGREAELRNATIIFPGRLDRSPCGTGTAARLAVMLRARSTGRRRGNLGALDHRRAFLRAHCRHGRRGRSQGGATEGVRTRVDLRTPHAGRASGRPVPARIHPCRHVGHRSAPPMRSHRIHRPCEATPGVPEWSDGEPTATPGRREGRRRRCIRSGTPTGRQ